MKDGGLMSWPYEVRIGWRYTRAGRAGRRNGFISFISAVSMLGIALGVAALIIVLSVMNGFQKEVRDRMLSMVAHVEIHQARGLPFADWRGVAQGLAHHPEVQAAAPFVSAQALIARGEEMQGVQVRGVLPEEEIKVTPLAAATTHRQGRRPRAAAHSDAGGPTDSVLKRLVPGEWGVVIGWELARVLGVKEGDRLTVVTPNGQVTPAGVVPRLKQVTVVGLFNVGHYQFDSAYVLMHLDDAAKIMRTTGPTGIQLRLSRQEDAKAVAARLQREMDAQGEDVLVTDWTRTNREWFAATQVEKRMMFIILTLIVAVAAFNLVSTLVMSVTDKRADIAILRTLGASPQSVMAIFMVQGAASGVIGTALGLGLGLLVAFHIDVIVPAIEQTLNVSFLPSSIYVISDMPSEPLASDIWPVAVISLVLAFLATLYPSWRASRVQPAQALRYE